MSFEVIWIPFLLITINAFIHVSALRFLRKFSEDRLVFSVFLFIPVIVFVAIGILTRPIQTEIYLIFFLYIALASAYISSYPAVYAACPTLIIAKVVQVNGARGTQESELEKLLGLSSNSIERIHDAEEESLIKIVDNRLSLTKFGTIIYMVFKVYRKIIGLERNTI